MTHKKNFTSLLFALTLVHCINSNSQQHLQWAERPPMGWNSMQICGGSSFIGGGTWPDADMLPLGKICLDNRNNEAAFTGV